jgi:hypothetical protein
MPLAGKHGVANGIDLSMHGMQAPARHTTPHSASAETEPEQLDEGNDPVLPTRQLGDRAIDRGLWLLRPPFRR